MAAAPPAGATAAAQQHDGAAPASPREQQQQQGTRRVLCAVADDDMSEQVFAYAVDNILQPTDHVHLLHVMVAVPNRDLRLDYFDQHDEKSALAAQQPMLERRYVQRLRDRGLAGLPVVIHLVQASEDAKTLGRVICRHADQVGAGLVIMGGPEHSRLHDLLFGNAAAYVEANCARPVRIVRRSELEGGGAAGGPA
ncbi:hypothetical protein Rsub_10721 [Raphidocelis subcapitata]|uniref:UspA domain-containing protein n=1 Tax=Raphidocelis subcapitata TaxID=307507 RepID=A0A2V0PKM2_9CHLO|nr:hypothetical protein Rsub_10721 [Raphidocelis subcapitata]|eukprot:GBF97585.1 hypothetical protein Rsub_10721 [Raphidocelis subcapitata]